MASARCIQVRRSHVRARQLELLVAGLAQRRCALRIRTQKAAIARVLVVDEQRRFTARQPIVQEVVRHGRLFFDIVCDKMAVLPEHVIAEPLGGQQMTGKDFDLERKVEQVVLQAKAAKADGSILRLREHDGTACFPIPRCLEPVADFSMGKADERGFVEVIDLAIDAGMLEMNAFEITRFSDQRFDHASHVILRCFEREENRRPVGMGEPGPACHTRPKQVYHLPRQAADGQQPRATAGRQVGAF